jgi:hypothetical protein
VQPPLENLHEEGERLLAEAGEQGVTVRAMGGVAIWMLCESARSEPLRRPMGDIDLVGLSRERQVIAGLLERCGYLPDQEFNLYHGTVRMIFHDPANARHLDLFLDVLNMCHALPLADRLALTERTLTPADLLLSKLQIVELNERDLKDATALLADCTIDRNRLAGVLAADWGWWRTATENLARVGRFAAEQDLDPGVKEAVLDQLRGLEEAIAGAKKSLKWRARARVGERVPWYVLPEESIDDEPGDS